MDVKKLKMEEEEEEEDLISELPDAMIHHILSFLPSTRDAIRTTVLSKRWKNQWTRVPVLVFESPTSGMFSKRSNQKILRLINNALPLHDCSKIKKLQLGYNFEYDPDFVSKILFATTRGAEQLSLISGGDCYLLPDFLLENSSLIELEMVYCCFRVGLSVHWGSLKVLKIDGWSLPYRPLIGKLVSGCPLLESLEFRNSRGKEMNDDVDDDDDDVIASKTLKRLILADIRIYNHMKISCPNLAKLVICLNRYFRVPEKTIEISCPKLESVDLYDSSMRTYKLVNCLSLVYANLDFEIDSDEEDDEYVAMKNLEQLQNVMELTVRSWFTEILSALKMEGRSYSMLNNKSLTLLFTNFEDFHGITSTLHSSPALERLVIKLPVYVGRMMADLSDLYEPRWSLNDCGENYWNSNKTDVNCLVSHLKFVKISGFNKREAKCKIVINFIEFLLKNARVLEKLVVVISNGRGTDFASKLSQKVLSFPKNSQHTIVEVLCS